MKKDRQYVGTKVPNGVHQFLRHLRRERGVFANHVIQRGILSEMRTQYGELLEEFIREHPEMRGDFTLNQNKE